uniref:MAK10-like protein n=1 Tax=Tanacetum cinerariifolium TaxID=118510 RepID=A0A6L2K711_TANCI|nr:MAK10-like protein [Tanacetum cinerariifolium]
MGDENPIRTLGDYSKPTHEGYRNTIELPKRNNVMPLRSDTIRLESLFLKHGLLSRTYSKKSFIMALIFGSKSKSFMTMSILPQGKPSISRPVAISLPQYVPSTSDPHLIKLENQVQHLMEAHLAPKQPIQVNRITSLCEICSVPHDTQYCMENPEQAFADYTSSRTNKAGGKWYTFKPEKKNLGDTYNSSGKSHPNLRCSIKFKDDSKQQQSEMTNKIDTVLKAITDRMIGALPSDIVKNSKLNVNSTSPFLSARSHNSINTIKTCSNRYNENDQLKIKTLMVNKVGTPRSKEPEHTLEDEFKDLHLNLSGLEVLAYAPIYNAILDQVLCEPNPIIHFKKLALGLLEETDHVFRLADGTTTYLVGVVKYVEVHIGRLKLMEDFYVIDMKKDPETPLLVERGFLATASAMIDCKKANIAVGEGITTSVFEVKEIDLESKEVPYWTTLRRRESYGPRHSMNYIGISGIAQREAARMCTLETLHVFAFEKTLFSKTLCFVKTRWDLFINSDVFNVSNVNHFETYFKTSLLRSFFNHATKKTLTKFSNNQATYSPTNGLHALSPRMKRDPRCQERITHKDLESNHANEGHIFRLEYHLGQHSQHPPLRSENLGHHS